MYVWTAFVLGIFGSLHCIGMCGPIALALPFRSRNQLVTLGNILLYNSGRVLSYVAIGSLIGLIGTSLSLAGIQVYVSILLGVLLLMAALFSVNIESKILRVPAIARFNAWVKTKMANLLREPKVETLFALGTLNGLLPCGLVYLAVAGAVAVGSVQEAALYMGLFGLGTLPMMLGAAFLGQFISLNLRRRLRRLMPVFLLAFALLFIARGLHFELPDQFRFWEIGQEVPMCH